MFPSSEAFEKRWREGNLQAISIRSVSYQHGWESWRINWTRHRCRSRTLQTWLRSRGSADDRLYSQNSSCLDWRVAQMLGLLLRLCHVNGSVLNRHPAHRGISGIFSAIKRVFENTRFYDRRRSRLLKRFFFHFWIVGKVGRRPLRAMRFV